MKICYFCLDEQEIPTKKYFYNKYGKNLDRPDKETVLLELANIFSKWKHVADNDGRTDGQYAKKMSGYDFIEIRIKRSNVLIRFPYYRDCTNDRLVLLIGFEKKDGYKFGDKTDRYAKRKLKEAQGYYEKYKDNNRLYINMPSVFENLYKQLNF